MVVLAELEADFAGGEQDVVGRDFLADTVKGLENTRRQLAYLARPSFDNQAAVFVQAEIACAVESDSDPM